MITFNNKQVIVVGVDDNGDCAIVHPVDAMGTSLKVMVGDLRAMTIQELEDALVSAPVIPTAEEVAELEDLDDRCYDERSERQGDLIAAFRAEY